jgi:hypothetical protein
MNVLEYHPVLKHMQAERTGKLQMECFLSWLLHGIEKLVFWVYSLAKAMLHTVGMLSS